MYVLPMENVHPGKNRPSKKMSVWASILEPSWLHAGFKNHPKSKKNGLRKGIKFSIDFGIDFCSVLGARVEPCWPPLGSRSPERPPGPLQAGSKTPPRRFRMPPETLWIAQDGPRGLQTCPGTLQTSILGEFGSMFGPFGLIFG